MYRHNKDKTKYRVIELKKGAAPDKVVAQILRILTPDIIPGGNPDYSDYKPSRDNRIKHFTPEIMSQFRNMFGLMSHQERMLFRSSFFFIGILSVFIFSCGSDIKSTDLQTFKMKGIAQGTTYTIQVVDASLHISKFQIDPLLFAFDEKLSTYKTSSLISRFNQESFKFFFLNILIS